MDHRLCPLVASQPKALGPVKFCEGHWTKLRDAIYERGLGDLVAQSGERAARNVVEELKTGEPSLKTFDPLMGAHWAIVNRIAEHRPLVVFCGGCPLCWVQDGHAANCTDPACPITRQTFEDWIPSIADFMVTERDRLLAAERGD